MSHRRTAPRRGRISNARGSTRRPPCSRGLSTSMRTWSSVSSTTSRSSGWRIRTLHSLFRAKRDEIARQITLLEDRGTSRFRNGALQLLEHPRFRWRDGSLAVTHRSAAITRASVPRRQFAEAAQDELDVSVETRFHHAVEARRSADLMVSFGRLLIRARAVFSEDRVEPYPARGRHPCAHLSERRFATL